MTDAVAPPSEPAEPPRPDPGSETGPEAESERDAADELCHNIQIGRQAAGRNLFNAPVYAHTVRFGASGDEADGVLTWWPLPDEFADPPPSFVAPPTHAALQALLSEQRVVVLAGGDCGNLAAAGAALRAGGHRPVVELPAGPTTRELLTSIERVTAAEPTAGIAIPAIGEEALRGFGAAERRRLRGALDRGAAVILTTRAQPSPDAPAHALPSLQAQPPDPAAVILAHAPTERDPRERALAALALLATETPVGPGAAVRLLDAARADAGATPERLAALVGGRSDALDEWLAAQPTAEHVAALTAAVALDGAPSADVDAEALALRLLLEGEREPSDEPRRFGPGDRGWPAGVVTLNRRPLRTYFGVQEAEVVEVCPPHSRERLLAQLWDRLGTDFRGAVLDWLRALAEHANPRVRSGAAVTAGILFAKEPVTAERELLRPWALDGRHSPRACAGLAIGVPVLLGHDPAPARALAHAWSEPRGGANRRRAAIAAYGGPLGAWDAGAAAPARLWLIAAEPRRRARGGDDGDTQQATERARLRRDADDALAGLVAAGARAGQVRATVVSLLAVQARERDERERAFGLLPKLLRRLTRGDELARDSLDALLGEAEQATFAALTALLAHALDTSPGFASARGALRALLDALGAGRVEEEVVHRVVRGMKAGARPGRRAALGQQLERILAVERRGDGARSRAAATVHAVFFSTPQEVR